ncbi:MAG: hypothetical protein J6A36_03205 [Clostridia bacterium]|nr:hypothetical protein [Clostridia bacterium]
MLILAGVSINAIVGEDGILSKAQLASQKQKLASDLEALQLALMNHSIASLTDGEEELDIIVDDLLNQSLIDSVDGQKDDSGNYIDYNQYTDTAEDGTVTSRFVKVKKGDNSFRVFLNEDGTFSADVMTAAGGGTLTGGTYEVTEEAFASGEGITDPNDRGKFTIEGDTKVIFNDPLGVEADGITANGQMLSIEVKSGAKVKVYFNANSEKKAADGNTYYKLTNQGLKRSAIDIEPGGQLDLVIGKNVVVEVNSGLGEDSDINTPGKGGYAGIHVPWNDSNNDNTRDEGEYATLNVYGNGVVKSIGGNAGNGAEAYGSGSVTAGGGGAGAGIGGNGGNGAKGMNGIYDNIFHCPDGGKGENCGVLNIYNSITVYAYGGAGGFGGTGGAYQKGGSGGGGGYPGAGIGGGGAGGAGSTCCAGGSGYTAGSASGNKEHNNNGKAGYGFARKISSGVNRNPNGEFIAGGYFQGTTTLMKDGSDASIVLGGYDMAYANIEGHKSGSGGTGGMGGIVKSSANANIYSFNGNMYTDGTSYENGLKQCPIYLQAGIITAKYISVWESGNLFSLVSEQGVSSKSGYNNTIYESNINYKNNKTLNINTLLGITGNPLSNVDMSTQGIGSGAGYIEVSNGTYEVDASMN